MPPTSPSDRYIEAASDNSSLRSSPPITPPGPLAWLTKDVKVSPKNVLSSYHGNMETQTDSSVTSISAKTGETYLPLISFEYVGFPAT